MPAYNAGKYIEAAIRSVMEQESFPEDSEIIVIDDGSSDETEEIARSNGAVVLTQDHKGAACARNTGRLYRKNEMANYAKILRAKIAAGKSEQKRS